eukprot:comp9461_c0_seq1/m.4511 comp9461_c0_seq1/g.4511  ORF comp9461_c0_seq1/g.4511 comp9461_c0_seq1/m.4511 type:complete len:949 (-) comp9461_c0_seq1:594-3440(-)
MSQFLAPNRWAGLFRNPTVQATATRQLNKRIKSTFAQRWTNSQVIGIRRENKGRWERRAALSPEHVKVLVNEGYKVLVQPSNLRVFANVEYQRAGAEITDDLSPAGTILGVKEVPVTELLDNRTYFFFSHTHKAQEYNMQMLDAIVAKQIRLIDYEKMVNDKGERIVLFGRFAGIAGMTDLINGLGNRMLGLGYQTPFLYTGVAKNYKNLDSLKGAVRELGQQIADHGVPPPLRPFTVVFTGNGNVSKGAQEIFRELPHKWVTVDELRDLVESGDSDPHLAYGVLVEPKDYLERITGSRTEPFNKRHFYENPQDYRSVFHTKILPYTTAIVNCMYWDARYPRIITREQMKEAVEKKTSRLVGVGDISADPNGAIEFMTHCTTIDEPFILYDPVTGKSHFDITGKGVLIMSVDNLPAELPSEATAHFGSMLLPYLQYYLKDPSLNQDDAMSQMLKRATITDQGSLTPTYKYITDLRKANAAKRKQVLLLGSGMVAGPLVDYLARFSDTDITIASLVKDEADKLAKGRRNIKTMAFNIAQTTPDELRNLVGQHNVTISFLPAGLHHVVADACVSTQRHLVTASYISPDMRALHERAHKAKVILLNEIGLDPGIDHLSAMKLINDTHRAGGQITSFMSWCGGLPAPEASDNALGYKFSWSPRAAISAGLNSSTYIYNGKVIHIPGHRLYGSVNIVPVDDEFKGFRLEGLPNRNALSYAESYNLSGSSTLFRGTLRYAGYSRVLQAFADVGMMGTEELPYLRPDAPPLSWRELMVNLVPNATDSNLEMALLDRIPLKTDADREAVLAAFSSLRMLSSEPVSQRSNHIDTLCALLTKKLCYKPGERDMVIMRHLVGIEWPNKKKEIHTSTLVAYGAPHGEGDSAMATTVGIPAGIAARMILDGTIKRYGVLAPVTEDIYEPMLELLGNEGIALREGMRTPGLEHLLKPGQSSW